MQAGTKFICSALLLFFCLEAGAQALYPVSLDAKVNHSSLIFEGKVIAQEGFWNDQHSMIYTSNKIEIYKIFKGAAEKDTVEINTVGGCVSNRCIIASHLLKLEKDDLGIFFCRDDKYGLRRSSRRISYEVYSSSQGFLRYDPGAQSASAPFAQFANVDRQLYPQLQGKIGRAFTNIRSIRKAYSNMATPSGGQFSNQVLAASITSFSPTTVTGGTLLDPANNVLTINGTGFSSTPSGSSAVLFDNPDDGQAGSYTVIPFSSPYIISWTNTQIKVRVPTSSASGLFYVRDITGSTLTNSVNPLTVLFNVMDIDFTSGSVNYIKEARLVNMNGLGGYTVLYSNSTANSGVDITATAAQATFQRAMKTWKECSGFNVTEGGSSSAQKVDPYDGSNMVMFDNSFPGNTPLADGVLAVCYSGFQICPDNLAVNQAYKSGFDIVIRSAGVSIGNTITFTYGPCSPYSNNVTDVDLETVLLHELGHAVNMGHILDDRQGSTDGQSNPAKVMYYAVYRGLRRISEDYSAKSGAAYMTTPRSVVFGACSALTEMTPLAKIVEPNDECPAVFPTLSTPNNTTVTFDLVHATSNKFVDPNFGQMSTGGLGMSITNTAYYALKTAGGSGSLDLSVSGYTTNPAALGSCTMGPPAIAVTGVKMALYQVSSCPTAQSFPIPVFSTTFSSDGLISIPGLNPNTTYLMAFDGVENTKAIFTLGFSGAILPLRISDFTGISMSGVNRLWWLADVPSKAVSLKLERSADGIAFHTVSNAPLGGQGTYDDKDPFPGNNYYRLAIRSSDNTVEYSRVIVLNNPAGSVVTVYPNPATHTLNIALDRQEPGEYSFILHNTLGQAIWQKKVNVGDVHDLQSFNVDAIPKGIYHLTVIRPSGTFVKSVTVTFQ